MKTSRRKDVKGKLVQNFFEVVVGTGQEVLMSFVFVIGPIERAVLASYTMVVPARLHNQCTGANSQSELVIPNWL